MAKKKKTKKVKNGNKHMMPEIHKKMTKGGFGKFMHK